MKRKRSQVQRKISDVKRKRNRNQVSLATTKNILIVGQGINNKIWLTFLLQNLVSVLVVFTMINLHQSRRIGGRNENGRKGETSRFVRLPFRRACVPSLKVQTTPK